MLDGRVANGPANNIDPGSGRAVLVAGQGIGSTSKPLVADLESLQANAGSGVLSIGNRSSANLTVGGEETFGLLGSSVTLTTAGTLRIDENVVANQDVRIQGQAIAVAGNTAITSADGLVSLTATEGGPADYLDRRVGIDLQENTFVSAGGRIDLLGTGSAGYTFTFDGVLSGSEVNVLTGAGDDSVSLGRIPFGMPISMDGGEGFNILTVYGTAGNDTFDVRGDSFGTLGGVDAEYLRFGTFTINARTGKDVFNVYATSVSASQPRVGDGTYLIGEGDAALNIWANGADNAPVVFIGREGGVNPVKVVGNTTSGDTLVVVPEAASAGDLLPGAIFTPAENIVGAGLALQVRRLSSLDVTMPAGGSEVSILAVIAPTTVTTTGSDNVVRVGGDRQVFETEYGVILTPEVRNLGLVGKSLTLSAGPGANNRLELDNRYGAATCGQLYADSLQGVGEASGAEIRFTGFDRLAMHHGRGDLSIENTIAGPVVVAMGYDDSSSGNLVTVRQSASTDLSIRSINAAGVADRIVFDNSAGTASLDASFADGTAPGSTRVTNFGPIGPTTFQGFAEAVLLLGVNNDQLEINTTIPTLRVVVRGGAGADVFTVRGNGDPVELANGVPTATPKPDEYVNLDLRGEAGDDTVKAIVADAPSQPRHEALIHLRSDVERMIVDNAANAAAVDWFTSAGAIVGYRNGASDIPLLDMSLVEDVSILGGISLANSLTVNAGSIQQKGSIDGNKVTLQSAGFLQFARLTSVVSAYSEGNFTFRGAANGQPNLAPDVSLLPAVKAAQPGANAPIVMTATDGGLYSLYAIDLSGTGTAKATGTTATGRTVSASFNVSSVGEFKKFVLPADFVSLTSVSFEIGNLLMTNLAATETLRPGATSESSRIVPGYLRLDAADGSLFTLASLKLIGQAAVEIQAINANGVTLVEQVGIFGTQANVQTLVLPATWTDLVSVTLHTVSGPYELVSTVASAPLEVSRTYPVLGVMPQAPQAIVFDTDASGQGIVSVAGNPAPPLMPVVYANGTRIYLPTFNGTPYSTQIVGNTQVFTFYGNLNIPAGSTVKATDRFAASIYASNDINIGANVTFDVSGAVGASVSGGGAGGSASSNLIGGQLGAGASRTYGGTGGIGFPSGGSGLDGNAGTGGNSGASGNSGTVGQYFWNYGQGDAGVYSSTGGTPGNGGTAGLGGAGGISTARGGAGSPAAVVVVEGGDDSYLIGYRAPSGEAGQDAQTAGSNGTGGSAGTAGSSGSIVYSQTFSTLVLAGGSGGGAGGLGGPGGGGGAGASGAGGGSGAYLRMIYPGGEGIPRQGGAGGDGGLGGAGGDGGAGGFGGDGGGGGGAFGLSAAGRIQLNATNFLARGGNGGVGNAGQAGQQGGSGSAGQPGYQGETIGGSSATYFGAGSGGNGGSGTAGGDGGAGGTGGVGGGGAGGTILLYGSAVYAGADSTIDATGGLDGAGANRAMNGQFLYGSNTATVAPTQVGIGNTIANSIGTRGTNPYLSEAPLTPFIAGMLGGADTYGLAPQGTLLSALTTPDGMLRTLAANAPVNALASIVRMDIPEGFDQYVGYDLVVFINLTSMPLADPRMGLTASPDSMFAAPLAFGGVGSNATFQKFEGGGSLRSIGAIPAQGIFVTLVPKSDARFVNASLGGSVANVAGESLNEGDAYYITLPGGNGPGEAAIRTYSVLFSSMDALTVTATGVADDIINQIHSAPVSSLTIDLTANTGNNQVNVLDVPAAGQNRAQTINVYTGAGNDLVTVYAAQANHAFDVDTGAGNDRFVFDGDSTNNASAPVNARLGSGDDIAQVTGIALASAQSVFLDGGPNIDTLLHDAAGRPERDDHLG